MKSLFVVAMIVVLVGAIGCRSAPPVTVDPAPLCRAAGSAAVQLAVLSGEVTREQLSVIRPYVQTARDLAAAAPPDRPTIVADVLLAALPADSPDTLMLRAYIVNLSQALRVETTPDVEKGARLAAAFLSGVDDAIGILTAGTAETGEDRGATRSADGWGEGPDHCGKSAGALPA